MTQTNYGSMSVEEAALLLHRGTLQNNNNIMPTDEYFDVIEEIIQAQVDAAYERGKQDAKQWQPIETAPKDGIKILLYASDQILEGRWDKEYQEWEDADYFYIFPTHWMPRAEPPKGDE